MLFSQFVESNKPQPNEHPKYQALQEIAQAAKEVDGVDYFEPSAVQRAYKQNPMSRETVIHLSPDQFLSLANKLSEPKPDKEQTIDAALKSGSKLSDLPYLSATTNAKGDLEIDGHEGRHRMLALKKAGVRNVPVILISGEGGNNPCYRWGTNKDRPRYISGQDGRNSIKMPKTETY